MSNRKLMTREEFEREGERRFGKEKWNWKFQCPICKTVMTARDYKNAGAREEDIAFNCIGRFLAREKSQRAFNDGKHKNGIPCDYSGGGLFKLNPIEFEDGSTWFDFADENL